MLFNISFKQASLASFVTLAISLPTYAADLACQLNDNTDSIKRVRFATPEVPEGTDCQSEVQFLSCDSEGNASWSGQYSYVSCRVGIDPTLPLMAANQWQFEGAFLLPNPVEGYDSKRSFELSDAVMAYNPSNDSLFIVGHTNGQNVAEVEVPTLIKSNDFEEMARSQYFYQDFTSLNEAERMGETIANFRINGMAVIDGQLVVNFMDKKSYGGIQSTTLVVRDMNDLEGSALHGPLLLNGDLHASGSISEIPQAWQLRLQGNYLASTPGPTIASLTSQGPTAFSFDASRLADAESTIATNKLLGFSHSHSLFDHNLQDPTVRPSEVLQNENGLNDWWTINSLAVYSFILPGSSTLITIGKSNGHHSGIGYKITQDDGTVCGGYCANQANDQYGFIWLWDLRDLQAVHLGALQADEVNPYYYGKFDTPFGSSITGATYDVDNNRLFVATSAADATSNKKPVISVYDLSLTPTESELDCQDVKQGEYASRIKYRSPLAVTGQICEAQEQRSYCQAGVMSAWSGEYIYDQCQSVPVSLPKAEIEDFEFLGGFRITGDNYGEGKASTNMSRGIFTYNPKNHSIFVIGSPKEEQIAEFAIPELIKSSKYEDYLVADEAIQQFTYIHGTERVDTGIEKYFKVTGLELVDDKLLVNYVNWYDGNGTETDTTLYYDDASDLANSSMYGPFQLDGKAHGAGWLSKIPDEWTDVFNATYIAGGQSGTSIISRLSVGPSAFMINPHETIFGRDGGAIPTERLMDFPLSDMLYDKNVYGNDYSQPQPILFNENGLNDLWTTLSGAGYGFIIPGTRTYVTIGKSGGIESGVGYKIRQEDGYLCPGPCSYDSADNYPFYWLWDVEDLLKVKFGLLQAHDVRPYRHGKFPMPEGMSLRSFNGGSFDPDTGTLYLASPRADTLKQFHETPVFLAFKFDQH
jgi:hypothetical protein